MFVVLYNYFPKVPQFLSHIQQDNEERTNSSPLKFWLWLPSGIILGISSIAWYLRNWGSVKQHLAESSSWGYWDKQEPFIIRMIYWFGAAQQQFFFPSISLLILFVFITGLIIYLVNKRSRFIFFDICALISLLTICAFLIAFSLTSNKDNRYLLPLSPHVSLLIAWSLNQIKGVVVSYFLALVLIVQLVIVHWKSLEVIPPTTTALLQYTGDSSQLQALYPRPPVRNPQRKKAIEELVAKTCKRSHYLTNILGFEKGWMNIYTLSYFAVKQQHQLPCNYAQLNEYGLQSELDVWKTVLFPKTQYYIGITPSVYNQNKPRYDKIFNNFALPILKRVEKSSNFKIDTVWKTQGVLLYRKQRNVNSANGEKINNKEIKFIDNVKLPAPVDADFVKSVNNSEVRFIDYGELPAPVDAGSVEFVNNSREPEHRITKSEEITLEGWVILPEKSIQANQVIITAGQDNTVIGVADVIYNRPDVAWGLNKPQLTKAVWVAIIENIPANYLGQSGDSVALKAWAYDTENKTAMPLINRHVIILK